ncbi:MAG: DNA methyltransferase [Chloroflexi bacterium]|nr:DNA methyltransferase [Chloroflexota bacterium]
MNDEINNMTHPMLEQASSIRRNDEPKKSSSGRTASSGISDLPLSEWREFEEILTDSLWLIGDRDRSGVHNAGYHGNFVPQIPYQLMRRYTRPGDIVIDPFLGSGTTMLEAQRLGRNCIGVELLPEMAEHSERYVQLQGINEEVHTEIIVGDSSCVDVQNSVLVSLESMGRTQAQLVIMHPPYHDIIPFSDDQRDLSNAPTVNDFVTKFGDIVEGFSEMLEPKHYLAIVIGDKYVNSELIPLGFHLMSETLMRGNNLSLKSIIVKNMVNNRAKRNLENLWRYRALAGGFYVFRHEYILLFKKVK